MALRGQTPEDIKPDRDDMLSSTFEDIRRNNDFIDEMAALNGVFTVLGKSSSDKAKFGFDYNADANTLKVANANDITQ